MRPLLDLFIDQENLYNTEGQRGVSNLCKIAAALGYKDPMHYGQLSQGGRLGDLMEFLSDNPACIEAIVNWIRKNEGLWADQLVDQVPYEDDFEDDEDGPTITWKPASEFVSGTSLEGFVSTTYAELKAMFGEPQGGGDKTTVQWNLILHDKTTGEDHPINIYDWKERHTPKGQYNWHIGAIRNESVRLFSKLYTQGSVRIGW